MSIEAMRMAQAYIRWNKFGECRTPGWDHPPPTAAEVDVALTNAIKQADKEQAEKQEPVGYLFDVEVEGQIIVDWLVMCEKDIEPDAHNIRALYTAPPPQERIVFPTSIRKMWSGSDVQLWLDANVNGEQHD